MCNENCIVTEFYIQGSFITAGQKPQAQAKSTTGLQTASDWQLQAGLGKELTSPQLISATSLCPDTIVTSEVSKHTGADSALGRAHRGRRQGETCQGPGTSGIQPAHRGRPQRICRGLTLKCPYPTQEQPRRGPGNWLGPQGKGVDAGTQVRAWSAQPGLPETMPQDTTQTMMFPKCILWPLKNHKKCFCFE